MNGIITKIEFEDYGFKYFHEGEIYIHYYQNHEVWCVCVSVRELERMMFGC